MMADGLQTVWGVLAELAHSDFGPRPAPRWYAILWVQVAHFSIGASLALFRTPKPLVYGLFYVWLAKEVLGDIPNGGGAWPVVADSVSDLCFGALGYIISKSRMEKSRHDQG